jgi:dipeptidyl aminopeptidase/acylaminoacyl peptidase
MLGASLVGALAGAAHGQTISPRRLLEVVDIGNPVISPDGRRVAFRLEQASVEHNRYDTAWYVQRLDGRSQPLRVADGGIPLREYASGVVKPAPALWSPDGRWIYYRALIDGAVAVWRAAADGSDAHAVTGDVADVRDFTLVHDGGAVVYSVGATREEVIRAEREEHDQGIRLDQQVFVGAGLFRSSQLEGRPATQRFVGDWFSTGPLLAEVPDRWKIVEADGSTGREGRPSERPPAGRGGAGATLHPEPWRMAVHPDDGRIATLTRTGSAPDLVNKPDVELAVQRASGRGPLVRCRDELCKGVAIFDVQWRPRSDEVLFTVVDRDHGRARSIRSWNVVTGAVRRIVDSRGLLEGSSQRPRDIPCASTFGTLVCVSAEADRPPRLERIDLEAGERHVLFDPNAALAADMEATATATLIRWKDSRGRMFSGYLFDAFRPGAPAPPLFVTFYTCEGFLRGGVGDEWPLATLAEVGISALCINGLPGQRTDITEHYGQGLLAVESVVEQLAGEGRIDGSRVGMGGLSYGNEAAMWTAMQSDLLTAVSSASPSITPTWYLFNSLRPGFRESVDRLWQLGAPTETPERWRMISPAYNLDRIRAPILFQLAEQEYLMALDYALPLLQAGRADAYVFPNEPHIKVQPRHKLAVYRRNLAWFRFWLQGHEDTHPSWAAQYAHWREIRGAVRRRPPDSVEGD